MCFYGSMRYFGEVGTFDKALTEEEKCFQGKSVSWFQYRSAVRNYALHLITSVFQTKSNQSILFIKLLEAKRCVLVVCFLVCFAFVVMIKAPNSRTNRTFFGGGSLCFCYRITFSIFIAQV